MMHRKKLTQRNLSRILLTLTVLLALLTLTACGQPTTSQTTAPSGTTAGSNETTAPAGYTFVFKNTPLPIGTAAKPILDMLGEPINFFESPSCAYQGMDRIYTYAGIEITTYTEGDTDYVYSVAVIDDSVSTPEGIALGASADEVKTTYGSDFTETTNQLMYRKGDTDLKFVFAEGDLVSIEYIQVTD